MFDEIFKLIESFLDNCFSLDRNLYTLYVRNVDEADLVTVVDVVARFFAGDRGKIYFKIYYYGEHNLTIRKAWMADR